MEKYQYSWKLIGHERAECCKRPKKKKKGERKKLCGYRFVQRSKVKNLPRDMSMLRGNTSLEAVTLEKLVKGTNQYTVTYLVSQNFTVAKIQPW